MPEERSREAAQRFISSNRVYLFSITVKAEVGKKRWNKGTVEQ